MGCALGDRVHAQAETLGVDAKWLRDLNKDRLKGLQLSSLLRQDTWLQIKSLDELAPFEDDAKPQNRVLVNRVVPIPHGTPPT
jgi:hypothetical protein